jgi:hypothetical protein
MALLDFGALLELDAKDPPTELPPLPVTGRSKEEQEKIERERERQRMEQIKRFMEDRDYPLNKPKGTLDHAFWHEAACSAAERQAAESHAEGSAGTYGAIGTGTAGGVLSMVETATTKVLGAWGLVVTGAIAAKARHDDDFSADRQADATRCRATK